MNKKSFRLKWFSFIALSTVILFNSCDKAENLLLSDSEILMKDLKGTYNLVSVRHEDFSSVNGGWSYDLQLDTTYSASGSLDIVSVDKATFNGTLSIRYGIIDETHAINGSASAVDDYEKLWVITDSQEDIQAFFMYSPVTSYNEGWLDERDGNHILLRVSETSWDESGQKNRYFRFEKAK
jgi:hypothetical protein